MDILDDQKRFKQLNAQNYFENLIGQIKKYVASFDVPATELERVNNVLQAEVKPWLPDIAFDNNRAKQLANYMVGKTIIINCDPSMYLVAKCWKLSANKFAKNLAWCNTIGVTTPDELLGWTGHPIEKPFALIDLISDFDSDFTKKMFKRADKELSGMRPKSMAVVAQGDTKTQQQLYLLLLGGFAMGYLAILNGESLLGGDFLKMLESVNK